MNKKIFAAGLGFFALSLALLPPVRSMADRDQTNSLITWEKKRKDSVELYLNLQDEEPAESLTAFSLELVFDSEGDFEEPRFTFGDAFQKLPVHETRYDDARRTLTLYAADREPVLEKTGRKVLLGTVKINSDENVTISVNEDEFHMVDAFREIGRITEFGDSEPYEMILKKPEETLPPETQKPEKPEKPEQEETEPEIPEIPETDDTDPETQETESDEEDDEPIWTHIPNGAWKQDGRGWWFSPLHGSYPRDRWFECSWNGKKGWYHFDAEGYMETGWFTDRDGKIYFLHDQKDSRMGEMYTGWHWIGGKCYYFTQDPSAGQPYGSLVRHGKTPDGYQVNEHGEWVVKGIVQVKAAPNS